MTASTIRTSIPGSATGKSHGSGSRISSANDQLGPVSSTGANGSGEDEQSQRHNQMSRSDSSSTKLDTRHSRKTPWSGCCMRSSNGRLVYSGCSIQVRKGWNRDPKQETACWCWKQSVAVSCPVQTRSRRKVPPQDGDSDSPDPTVPGMYGLLHLRGLWHWSQDASCIDTRTARSSSGRIQSRLPGIGNWTQDQTPITRSSAHESNLLIASRRTSHHQISIFEWLDVKKEILLLSIS